MGKALIIKGANFSQGAIVPEHRLVTALIGGGTGSGFISPYKFGVSSKAYIKFELNDLSTSTINIFGNYVTAKNFCAVNLYQSGGSVRYFAQQASSVNLASSHVANKVYEITMTRTEASLNNTTKVASSLPTSTTAIVDFGFCGNITETASVPYFTSKLKVYGFEQWDDDGNLIVDAVPCVKKDGTICFYNKVDDDYIYSGNGEALSYVE